MADLIVDNKFPCHALVPKNETGALNFLKKYPQFDGKDVTIAIFDSGVDPRATGLKTTLHGDTKVIERFDCTGCGDVDMSKKVTATADGYITGLSGKNLKVSKFMKTCNTSGDEYRVGLKSLFDLYPSKVRDKIIAENKNKKWDEPQKKVVADILREIDSFETKNSSNLTTLPLREKLKKENLDSSIEILNFFEKKYSEFKTTYDCILFPGEKSWIAVLDTTETGDLENALCINEYTKTHDIQSINDFLSISVNIHNEGNVLEIVGMCSSHGTHVASIASGYHADNRELDGLAPGSKIVSLTIGDGRLGSMETGTALVRAIIKIMELCNSGLKIDVINMSYGEHAHWSNGGRIGELMNEVVNKYGVVWVASAGNHGPALCTIGTPPDISQPSCIGVGAYVSRDMMEAEYTLRSKYSDVYTWTSRDPCIDGGSGVTVCAPGAAIASVPEFTMSKAQLMNGTSMAAPHVAGAVALLISGLKQKGIVYSPYSIKRALWNTATTLTTIDSFAQGNGLLNVEKAFENLISFSTEPETNIRFAVSVGNNNDKGIHMRQGILTKPEEFNVTVEPVFFNDKEISPREKINFNIRITLVPSAEWIQCGTYLDLCYSPRSFIVRVDPTGLRGSLFQASVKAYDSSNIEKGVLFEIPITVVQPTVINIEKILVLRTGDYLFTPNTIVRHFILVPKYATWAVLKMKSDHVGGKFLVHTMQILPSKYCKALETQKILPLSNEFETVHPFKCESDNVLEICVAKYWSNLGQTYVSKCLEFHGVYANGGNVMHAANGIHRMDVRALKVEEILPSISLKNAVMILKPSESKISPLTSRDVLPPCRQIYQNILTFNLHLAKQQEMSLHAPLFSSVLYESEFESQFWMIFDTNKMMIGCGDAYSNNNYIKLEKGDYVIRLQVRHEKKELLEKISDTNMLAGFKLSNPLCPDIYKTFNAAATGGKKITAFQLTNKTTKPIYVAPLSAEKITKAGLPSQCSWLEGTITFAKDEIGRKVDISPFQYILVEGPSVKKGNGTPKETKTKLEEYKDGLRDFQNMMIPKLDLEKAEEVYKELITNNPNFLAAHISMIQNLDSSEIKSQLPFTFKQSLEEMEDQKALKNVLQRIFDLSNTVIINTDVDALLSYYGLKSDTRSDAAKIKINMDKQKVTLLEAYSKKMIAYSKLHLMDPKTAEETDILDEIDKIYSGIGRFIDYNDTKVLNACVWHAFMHNHYGRMSKYLQKLYEEKLQREILEELCYVVKEIDWYHVQNVIEKIIVNTNPQGYRLF